MKRTDGRQLSHATPDEMRIRAVQRVEAEESPATATPGSCPQALLLRTEPPEERASNKRQWRLCP